MNVSAQRPSRAPAEATSSTDGISFTLDGGIALELLQGAPVMFSERSQQICELNWSSAVLAARLQRGATIAELSAELSRHEVNPEDARRWVMTFLTELSQLGLLTAFRRGNPTATPLIQHISFGGLNLLLEYASVGLFRSIGSAYAHLPAGHSSVDHRYHFSGAGDFVFISKDDEAGTVVERSTAAVQFKGMIIEDALDAGPHPAAVHAAFLSRNNRGLLLLGSPGSGKSTLALALLKLGWSYGSDDIALIGKDGTVAGLPLAPAVKEGAWNLVESYGYDLSPLPIHLRSDGQQVRFVCLADAALAGACQVDTIVTLHRNGSNRRAALDELPATRALSALLRESRSPTGKCSGGIFAAVTAIVNGARCFDLTYTEAAEAATLLLDIGNG